MRKKLVIGLCIMISILLASFVSSAKTNEENLEDALQQGIEFSIDPNKVGLYEVLLEGISQESSIRLIAFNTRNVVKIKNKYDIELLAPESGPVIKIHMKGVSETSQANNLKLAEVGNKGGFVQTYAIDPTDVNFTEAEVTATAKGTVLYKCKDWNFTTQTCYGEWVKLMDITPGEEYTFTLTPEDPGFAESISDCIAEDSVAKGSFNSPCDDTTGASLEKDDTSYETHTYEKIDLYGGVRIQSVNSSITNCGSVDSVEICYKWWRTNTATPKDCDISVDAHGGANYTTVNTTCPGTTEPASITCTDVTSLENWTCSNFFGNASTRAYAKSEISRVEAGAGTTETATWDALYFNVTYTLAPPNVTIIYPANGATYNTKSLFIRANIIGENIDTCWYNLNDAGNIAFNCSSEPNITAVEGLNNLTVYANNTDSLVGNDSASFTVNSSIPLTISISYPPNSTINTATQPKLRLLAVDRYYNLINYNIYVYYENGTLFSVANGTLTNNTETEIVLCPGLDLIGNLTTYKIIANATDAGNNNANSGFLYYTLTIPAVELVDPPCPYWDNDGNISFSFKVYDDAFANLSCSLYIDEILNQTNNQTLTGGPTTTFNVTGINESAYIVWTIECTDPANNVGLDSRIFHVDKTIPVINWINDTPDPANESEIINITANVTDNLGVKEVIVNISGARYYMTYSAGDIYYYEYNTSGLSGNYSYIVEAYDNADNAAIQQTGNFTVISVGDITPPTSNSPADQTVDLGQETAITWVLQDETAPGYYYVKRNGQVFAGPSSWSNNTPIIIKPNNYFLGAVNYTIYYNDSSGNNGIQDIVIVNVIDNSTPSCDELEEGGPTLINITVDGDMTDWDAVLANPKNYVPDLSEGGGDTDAVSANTDLVMFAYTWDDQYIYLYYRRLASGKNIVSTLAYIDYGNDGYMNSTDQVVKFVWSGSNQKYDSDLYNYIPSGTADLMNGSGYDLPGSITVNKSLETTVTGGGESGIQLETRVLWSDLGFSKPAPLNLQPASALGSGTNLPSHLEDNINAISTLYASILFRPDRIKSAKNGTSVYYDHDLMNCGIAEETVELTNLSSQGWNITLYYPNETLITDTNNNSNPDILLDVENYTTLIVKVDVPSTASLGTIDITGITAASSIDVNHTKTVTDTTTVGDITIIPNKRNICGVAGSAAFFDYTVSNYQAFADTIEARALSAQGWNVTLHYANGTILGDTDNDNHSDIGSLISSESRELLVRAYIPQNETIGANDLVTIRINSSANPSLTTTATANITARKRITIEPDYGRAIGQGTSTYYELAITNCWNESDVIEITHTSLLNWTTEFYEDDKVTLLADTDNDSIIDIGELDGCGGEHDIYAKISAPQDPLNYTEYTVVYANSSLNSAYDTALINTSAQNIITYDDASRSIEQTVFEVGDTVYARAYNLLAINNVYYLWISPNATLVRTSQDIDVTAEDNADDELVTNTSLLLGNWTLIVFNAQNDQEIGRSDFQLLDLIHPQWSNNKTYPPSGVDYSPGQTHQFNVTWTDDVEVDAVIIEHNFTGTLQNYTITTNVSSEYYYNWTGIEAGTYVWREYANDTSGNWNYTQSWAYVVQKNTATCSLEFSPLSPQTYGTAVNASCSCTGEVAAKLYRNGTDVTSTENNQYTILAAGDHFYNCTSPETQNYSYAENTSTYAILKNNSIVNLLLNGYDSNITVNQYESVNITAELVFPSSGYIEIYEDSAIINSGTAPLQNITSYTTPGTYNITVIYPETQNYTSSYETHFIKVIDITPPAVTLNFPPDSYVTFITSINFNWTATDNYYTSLECNLTINGTVNASNIQVQSGTPENYTVSGFEDGTYYWNVTCWDELSNTNTSETRSFIINTKIPTSDLNSPADNAVDVDSNITFNCSASDNSSLDRMELYINGILNQTQNISGTSNTTIFYAYNLANGNYSWTCKAYNYFNYSNLISENRTLVVNTTAAPLYNKSYFNGDTTDWISVPDIKNVCGSSAVLDNPLTDKIEWQNCVDASAANFDVDVRLEYNNATVIFGLDSTFNSSATITIRNLPWDATPVVYRNSEICLPPDCSNVSYNTTTGNAVFNVTHFTSYITAGNSQLQIWDETDSGMLYGDQTKYPNQQVRFFSNYTRTANGNPITGATCVINFTDSSGLMIYNATTELYEYNRSFATNGTFDWNVTCSKPGSQTLTTNDTVYITPDNTPPAITLNYPPDSYETTSTAFNLNWTASDNYHLDLTCNLTIDGVVNASGITSPNSVPANYTVSGFNDGIHDWNVTCWDYFNNTNTSETRSFKVDTTPPAIIIITPQNGTKYDLNENFTISANVTDLYSDVDAVYANVTWNSSSEIVTLAEVGSTGIYTGNFTSTGAYGRYNFTIFANDTLGNSNTADGYFEVVEVAAAAAISCTLTETPQVAESGEKVLFQSDLVFPSGNPVEQANITSINITVYRINNTNTTVVETGNMAFLQKGVWYYEFDADANENGNYMGVTNIQTNEVPPNYPSCSALFTISGRGVFRIIGISPDLVDVNETIRLATEVTFNGELVSASKLANPKLWVVQVNGTTQYYNETSGLGKAPGLIYLDGEFNQTGVYYLNWSVEYYNRTKNVQEIVVAKDWDISFGNISIGNQSLGEIEDLIRDNKNKLVELLSEMERQQEFSAEEIFLVTDAVNSMSRVANMLAEGEITDDEARQQIDNINSNLENRMGEKITGRLTNIFGSTDEGQSSVWWSLILLMMVVIIIVLAVKRNSRKEAREGKDGYRYTGRPRRRYKVLVSRIARLMLRWQNRSRHKQFEPKKDVPLAMFFKRRPAAERQQTLYESLSSGINRMKGRVKMKIKHSNFAPRRKRRYDIMIDKITHKIREARRKKQAIADERRQRRIQKALMARKAKPEEIFRPRPPKAKSRYAVMAARLRERMNESLMRRKAAKHIHKQKIRKKGHTHTRVKASDLFEAINEYKHERGVYDGTITGGYADKLADEYDAGARTAVFEESRTITGLRNAVTAIKDRIPSEKIKSAASKIPMPKMPKIRIPRIRMPHIDAGVRIRNAGESTKAAGISIKEKVGVIIRKNRERINAVDDARMKEKLESEIPNSRNEASRKAAEIIGSEQEGVKEKLESKIPNSRNEVSRKLKSEISNSRSEASRKIEAGKKEVRKNTSKKQKGKRRRYQVLAERIRKNFSRKKTKGPLELLKGVVEKENIAERIATVQNKEAKLENDKIRHLAWNLGQKGPGVGKSVISKAFPSEKDEGTFQSSDPEVTNLKLNKKQKLSQLRKMYDK